MRILALVLFGVAFGFVEAAVVVYLRALYEPMRAALHPGVPAADLFPLITLVQLEQAGRLWMLRVELVRELATILMVLAIALAAARRAAERVAAFAVAFGAWDIAFYVFLRMTISWPASLFTWDVLFLIPVPWYGPVIAPVFIAATMIAGGCWFLRRPFRLGAAHWAAILGGALILVAAFCWDWRNLVAGGLPSPFPWAIYWAGWALGAGGFLHAFSARDGGRARD